MTRADTNGAERRRHFLRSLTLAGLGSCMATQTGKVAAADPGRGSKPDQPGTSGADESVAQLASATTDDKMQIQELLARYAWCFDTADVDGFVGCFAEGATLCEDVFEKEDRWVGRDAIRSMAERFFALPGFAGRQHHASQILIEGSAERCRVRAFCFVIEPHQDTPCAVPFAGYYEDVVVKIDGRWLFAERMIRHWSGPVLRKFTGQVGVRVPLKRPTG